jgi:hypothetical protein
METVKDEARALEVMENHRKFVEKRNRADVERLGTIFMNHPRARRHLKYKVVDIVKAQIRERTYEATLYLDAVLDTWEKENRVPDNPTHFFVRLAYVRAIKGMNVEMLLDDTVWQMCAIIARMEAWL